MGKTDNRTGVTAGLKRIAGMLAVLLIMVLLCCGCGAGTTQTAAPRTTSGSSVSGISSPVPGEEDKKTICHLDRKGRACLRPGRRQVSVVRSLVF